MARRIFFFLTLSLFQFALLSPAFGAAVAARHALDAADQAALRELTAAERQLLLKAHNTIVGEGKGWITLYRDTIRHCCAVHQGKEAAVLQKDPLAQQLQASFQTLGDSTKDDIARRAAQGKIPPHPENFSPPLKIRVDGMDYELTNNGIQTTINTGKGSISYYKAHLSGDSDQIMFLYGGYHAIGERRKIESVIESLRAEAHH